MAIYQALLEEIHLTPFAYFVNVLPQLEFYWECPSHHRKYYRNFFQLQNFTICSCFSTINTLKFTYNTNNALNVKRTVWFFCLDSFALINWTDAARNSMRFDQRPFFHWCWARKSVLIWCRETSKLVSSVDVVRSLVMPFFCFDFIFIHKTLPWQRFRCRFK